MNDPMPLRVAGTFKRLRVLIVVIGSLYFACIGAGVATSTLMPERLRAAFAEHELRSSQSVEGIFGQFREPPREGCVDGPMGATQAEFKGPYRTFPGKGTSCAAPIVTALVALVRSVRPDLDAPSVVEIVKRGCDDIGDPGYDIYAGYGRVNFGKTVSLAQTWKK